MPLLAHSAAVGAELRVAQAGPEAELTSFSIIYLLYIYEYSICKCVCAMCVLGAQGHQKKGFRSPGTRVLMVMNRHVGYWDTNQGPWQEHQCS